MLVDQRQLLGQLRQLPGRGLHQGALFGVQVFGGALQTDGGLAGLLPHRRAHGLAVLLRGRVGLVVPATQQVGGDPLAQVERDRLAGHWS